MVPTAPWQRAPNTSAILDGRDQVLTRSAMKTRGRGVGAGLRVRGQARRVLIAGSGVDLGKTGVCGLAVLLCGLGVGRKWTDLGPHGAPARGRPLSSLRPAPATAGKPTGLQAPPRSTQREPSGSGHQHFN